MRSKLSAALSRRPIQIGAVVVVALVAGLVAWLVLRGDDESPPPAQFAGGRPLAASVFQLRAVPKALGHPIYWVGRRKSYTYELTQTEDGSVYVRYLSRGVHVGDKRPIFLTVGTYPRRNAIATVRSIAHGDGAVSKKLPEGGLAAASRSKRESVYLAYPGWNLLVEVYDLSPRRALRLASSGSVVPVR
jgi:hypothetical protein